MAAFQDHFSSATDYVAMATKASQAIAAFLSSAIATKSSLEKFKKVFFRSRKNWREDLSVCQVLEDLKSFHQLSDIRSLNGLLVPIMEFRTDEEESYKNVSKIIKDSVSSLKLKSVENQFLTINSKEWFSYGCSIQSTTRDRIQILSLVENEEANSIPILVTNRYYKNELDDTSIQFGVNASVTGLMVPIENERVAALIGAERTAKLKLAGSSTVLIPDETLINDLRMDFSYNPGVFFNKADCFFLGYLWVIYINVRTGEIVPIHEYGNVGEKNSFTILAEKLIYQIQFFKQRIWNELNTPPKERQYKLLISFNDALHEKVACYFQEEQFFNTREELLFESREDIIANLLN